MGSRGADLCFYDARALAMGILLSFGLRPRCFSISGVLIRQIFGVGSYHISFRSTPVNLLLLLVPLFFRQSFSEKWLKETTTTQPWPNSSGPASLLKRSFAAPWPNSAWSRPGRTLRGNGGSKVYNPGELRIIIIKIGSQLLKSTIS